jgi:predicted nucleic acid-binding protein
VIILDTNVVSELFRPRPDPTVARWLDRQDEAALVSGAFKFPSPKPAGAEV